MKMIIQNNYLVNVQNKDTKAVFSDKQQISFLKWKLRKKYHETVKDHSVFLLHPSQSSEG